MDRPCLKCHQYFDIREHNGKCPYCKFDNFKQNKLNNMKNFKDNQKVRHPKYGKGVINIVLTEGYYVVFNEVETKLRPFNDDFYNQLEAVEDLPNVGEYAYFWDDGHEHAYYAKFKGISNDPNRYKYLSGSMHWQHFSKTPPFK